MGSALQGNDSQDLWLWPLILRPRSFVRLTTSVAPPHLVLSPLAPCPVPVGSMPLQRKGESVDTAYSEQGSLFLKGGMKITRRIQNKNSLIVVPLGEGKSRMKKRGFPFYFSVLLELFSP